MTTPASNATPDPNSVAQSSAPGSQPQTPAASPEMVEKSRLDNALLKIQELTLANRSLSDQVTESTKRAGDAEASSLRQVSDAQGKVSELTKQLETATASITDLQSQLKKFQMKDTKIQALVDAKRPDLLSIIDVIEDGDADTVKAKIAKLADFSAGISAQREKELLAGVTHTEVQPNQTTVTLPTTDEGWSTYVNSLPLGSTERNTAMEAWHNQLMNPKS